MLEEYQEVSKRLSYNVFIHRLLPRRINFLQSQRILPVVLICDLTNVEHKKLNFWQMAQSTSRQELKVIHDQLFDQRQKVLREKLDDRHFHKVPGNESKPRTISKTQIFDLRYNSNDSHVWQFLL